MTGKENDRANNTGVGILGWVDVERPNDDIVDDAGDHHEVSEEKEGVDSHKGGEGERQRLQAELRQLEEAEESGRGLFQKQRITV